jgi:AdoMet-dependent heme synthase
MNSLLTEIEDKYWHRNQLHSLILELTHRCPCRCRHCYVVYDAQPNELTTAEVCDVLDQAREEGVVQLLLTGGEVLMRQDLARILGHAHGHRFFTSVLTTGLTLDEDTADLLAANKIRSVELSLLGATDAVNDDLMRMPGAFRRICRAAHLLRERGLAVILKATILRPNMNQLDAMADLAHALDCAFNASPMVAQRRGGGLEPRGLALAEEELAALNQDLLNSGLIPGEEGRSATLICKAGRMVAGVSPQGDVYPCILWPHSVGNLRERSLREIWHERPDPFLEQIRSLTIDDLSACAGCEIRGACRRCPGMAWQETGRMDGPAPSICAAARGHARALNHAARHGRKRSDTD